MGLGAGDRRVDRRDRDRLALERPTCRPDVVPEIGDDPLGLRPRSPDQLVAFAPGAASLLGRFTESHGCPFFGVARPVQRLAGLALGRPDPGERLLERALVLAETRPGIGDDLQAEPSRSAIANARLPSRPIVSRYVGDSVSRSNSTEALLAPGVVVT